MKPGIPRACAALLAVLALPLTASAQIQNLRITELNPATDTAEVTNTGGAFTDAASRPFCHRFVYTSVIPTGTSWTAGQVRTFSILGMNSADSDLWLYSAANFAIGSNIVHGLKFGPAANVGRSGLAASVGLWPSASAFCPVPAAGQTLAWDMFGNTPRDWYIDETPSLGSADAATTPSVASQLAAPTGTDDFEAMLLGDTVEGMIDYAFVNTSTTPGIFTVRCVNDVLSIIAPRPGSSSTQWLRIRDQDAGNVQNRFYTKTVSSGGDFNYSWTYYVNIEETPPNGANNPKLVIQHLDGSMQNAWGVEFTSAGASLIVTGIGGTAASTSLYPLSGGTGLGSWVKINLAVDFSGNTVSASFNDGAPVSLPINLSATADKSQFRLCYRGEGTGNIGTMLLDDVSVLVDVVSAAPLPPPVTVSDLLIRLDPVVDSGLQSPVTLVSANDGTGRLFAVEQSGTIRIIDANGNLLPTPFLDISASLPTLGTFYDERGLLGLAFHPNFASNGRFFVRYSRPRAGLPSEGCNDPNGFIVGCHQEVLSEFNLLSANQGDPSSEIELFAVDEPEFNHNSGTVAFGPDGYLYFTLGDGGGANDGLDDPNLPHGATGNGQNINTALGNMIRIDVDSPPDVGLNYAVPPSNPFVGAAGLDEIFAYGFRNPFKFSFDDGPGGDGKLIVADVGQNRFEEIDFVTNGGNYGWVIKEGNQCFDAFNPTVPPASCDSTGAMGEPLIDPIASYDHDNLDGISIIGGFVYRGSLFPALVGQYVFGDFSTSFGTPDAKIYFMNGSGAPSTLFRFLNGPSDDPHLFFLKGFGEDQNGEIYVVGSTQLGPTGTGGVVFHLVPAKGDMNGDGHITIADVPLFVDVLTGTNTAAHMIDRADIDDAGTADGADIAAFVNLLLP